jgi:hypothetical protein
MAVSAEGSPSENHWARLRVQVQEANPLVQDPLDVAAVLESLGWTDSRIEQQFGHSDIFHAAEELYQAIQQDITQAPLPISVEVSRRVLLRSVIRDLGHGLTFTLPMIVSVMAMITLHISFASYQYFSVANATAIGLATFFSFLTTGGFSQAMTNIYYVLSGMQKIQDIEATVFLLMRWAMGLTGVVAVLLLVVDFIFPIMPESLVFLMIVYLIMLSVLWLSFTGLYILRREYLLTVITAISIGVAYGLFRSGVPVEWAQAVAMGVASTCGFVASVTIFRRHTKDAKAVAGAFRTRLPQLAHGASPYFLYGILYFTYIYVDRLVAWTSQTSYLPYNVWFRGQYELGMDWSLAALFLPLSLAEVLISTVMRRIEHLQHRRNLEDSRQFYYQVRLTYFQMLAIFVSASVAGVLAAHIGVGFLAPLRLFKDAVPVHGVEPMVFTWSSWSYVLLSVAIFNVLLLFTLSYPRPALSVLSYGIILDVVLGVVCTQVFNGYQYAVFGLFGSAVFIAGYSVWLTLRLMPTIDYLLYRLA